MLVSRLFIALLLAGGVLVAMLAQGSALRLNAQDATPAAPPAPGGPAHLGGDLPGDPRIQLIQVATGFDKPVNLAFPPDDSGRLFVVEIGGLIRIVAPDGTVNPTPFLDLTRTVSLRPGQQGLLGLAFHPDFAKNGKFYVDYNNLYGNGAITVSEFQVDPKDPNQGSPKTERPLLTIAKPYPQHNGGTLRFGPDGYLYIATGDGGWQGDPDDNAQSRFSLLGKILRIDVDGGATGQPYGIPPDNPFAGPGRYDNPYPGQAPAATPQAGEPGGKKARTRHDPGAVSPENRKNRPQVRPEIWALGFRNPWQFAFDPANGDFYVGDVGADRWEEIDYQPAGAAAGQNYGWDWLEAAHCFPPELGEACPRQQVGVLPVAEYAHGDDGCAVIGLGVYRGAASPELDGIFFSGELCTGQIRGLQRDANGVWQFQNLLDTALQITGAGQDAAGDLYVTAMTGEPAQAASGADAVWKLVGADKVPAGAVTVPLGQPRAGDVAVDEDGAPLREEEGEAAAPAATPATEEAAAATAASGDAVVVGLDDFAFTPDRLRIPADTPVRIVVENHGAAPHNFSVTRQPISVDVAPGETAETTVTLPAGTYKVVCNVPGHKQAGMTGVLVAK